MSEGFKEEKKITQIEYSAKLSFKHKDMLKIFSRIKVFENLPQTYAHWKLFWKIVLEGRTVSQSQNLLQDEY